MPNPFLYKYSVLFQTIQFSISTHSPKLQHHGNRTIRLFSVINRTLVAEWGGSLPPLRRSSRCILQPPTDWATGNWFESYLIVTIIRIASMFACVGNSTDSQRIPIFPKIIDLRFIDLFKTWCVYIYIYIYIYIYMCVCVYAWVCACVCPESELKLTKRSERPSPCRRFNASYIGRMDDCLDRQLKNWVNNADDDEKEEEEEKEEKAKEEEEEDYTFFFLQRRLEKPPYCVFLFV